MKSRLICFFNRCEKSIPLSARSIEINEKKNRPPDLLLELVYECPRCHKQEKKYQRVDRNK